MSEPDLIASPGAPQPAASPTADPGAAGHAPAGANHLSLEGVHGSVWVPPATAGFWPQWRAYVGPALLVSVGYMDPGNWGTDLQAGAQYKYGLLWVVAVSSMMAIFLQVCSARLGIGTGKDLAQACRDWYPAWTRWPNWLFCEVAIAACDLAEVLGSAVALNLLFHIPIFWAVLITAFDVFLLLALQHYGMRVVESVVLVLIATIGVCYFLELFVLPPTTPNFLEMAGALVHPSLAREGMATVAIGIIGATVMPHNLYLHSALVQSRKLRQDDVHRAAAIRFNTIDSSVALALAFFINAAILVLAAMVFHGKDNLAVGGQTYAFNADTDWIRVAFLTLAPLLGTAAASILFAVALLASGQSSTITGTLAGQVVMEGFMHWRITPWVRRLITRGLAIFPAVFIIGFRGAGSINDLLVLSQVVLAMQLPFAMLPLMHFTSSSKYMGRWKNGWFLLFTGWASTVLITALDIWGLPDALRDAWMVIHGWTGPPLLPYKLMRDPLPILFDDTDLIAVAKPPGLAVIPGRDGADCLLHVLAGQIGLPASGSADPRLRVVHRIDKDTSGVVLLAKNLPAQRHISQQFQNNLVRKQYLAIVAGIPRTDDGEIDAALAPHPAQRDRMSVSKHGRAAKTLWKLERRLGRFSLIRCFPQTGKTHQIRVHLQSIGLPLAIDPLYCPVRSGQTAGIFLSRHKRDYRPNAREPERPLIARLTLHAQSLELTHPDGRRIVIECAPPKDFRAAVMQLGKSRM